MTFDAWTLWVLTGILLLIIELLTGTFVLVFFALGSLIAGALTYLPSLALNFPAQAMIFAATSLIGTLGFRKMLMTRLLKTVSFQVDMGKEIQLSESIGPHQTARISYQGSTWQATNLDTSEIKHGDRALVVGIDGNTLLLRKVS